MSLLFCQLASAKVIFIKSYRRCNLVPRACPPDFLNMAAKAGEALVNAGHVSGKYSKILGVLACERALWK
jgi:hypothetical protein